MASAPIPGAGAPGPRRRLRITLGGRTLDLDSSQLGPGDDLVARQQVGLPVTAFLNMATFGVDSLLIVWWMARRKSGEPNLTYLNVINEFPTYDAITASNPSAELIVDDEADDPEV